MKERNKEKQRKNNQQIIPRKFKKKDHFPKTNETLDHFKV